MNLEQMGEWCSFLSYPFRFAMDVAKLGRQVNPNHELLQSELVGTWGKVDYLQIQGLKYNCTHNPILGLFSPLGWLQLEHKLIRGLQRWDEGRWAKGSLC